MVSVALVVALLASVQCVHAKSDKLPKDFVWGSATAAYQIEGAWNVDGRGPSVWDYFSHKYPNNVLGPSGVGYDATTKLPTGDNADWHNGDEANKSYRMWLDDIELLKNFGGKTYRMSFSWSRLFPDGHAIKAADGTWNVNSKGVEYYDNVIDGLLDAGIAPFITLFHWDAPMALHSEYGGWLSYKIQEDFKNYATFAFEHFGDRVKKWLTFNEPYYSCFAAYSGKDKAPYRCGAPNDATKGEDPLAGCSVEIGPTQYTKDSPVLPENRIQEPSEPLWCTHNLLLSHGLAVDVYRKVYKSQQKGEIGITLDGPVMLPWQDASTTPEKLEENKKYAEILQVIRFATFSDPIFFGDYPEELKRRVGKDMPVFSSEEKELMKTSTDFLGWNTYTSHWVEPYRIDGKAVPEPSEGFVNYISDMWSGNCRTFKDGKCVGPRLGAQAGSVWLTAYPETIRLGLNWWWKRYQNHLTREGGIYITESGCSQPNDNFAAPNDVVTAEHFKSIGVPADTFLYDRSKLEHESDVQSILNDTYRVEFYQSYLDQAKLALLEDNVPLKGYMAWSVMDNFEWEGGYTTRFGMTYVDFSDGERKRIPKKSFGAVKKWFHDNIESESEKPKPHEDL